jgi:hypothetical protein
LGALAEESKQQKKPKKVETDDEGFTFVIKK